MQPEPRNGTGTIFICDRAPTSSETPAWSIIEKYNFWINLDNDELYICVDDTTDAMVWKNIAYSTP